MPDPDRLTHLAAIRDARAVIARTRQSIFARAVALLGKDASSREDCDLAGIAMQEADVALAEAEIALLDAAAKSSPQP